MKTVSALFALLMLAGCVQEDSHNTTGLQGFCGFSTKTPCFSDGDCVIGGCSNHVCESTRDNVVTTCEWRDCYASTRSAVSCSCVNNRCRWSEK